MDTVIHGNQKKASDLLELVTGEYELPDTGAGDRTQDL